MPRAWRRSDMTMIILTKEVIIISNDGNNVSTVIRTSICRVRLYSDAPDASVVTETAGRPWAKRGVAGAIKINGNNALAAFFIPLPEPALLTSISSFPLIDEGL